MANDFKRFCVPNVGTSNTTLYGVPAGAGSSALETIVIGITMANKTTAGITASIFIDNEDGSNDVFIVKDATMPRHSSSNCIIYLLLLLKGRLELIQKPELIDCYSHP